MPNHGYQMYQTERPKSVAEIRRANDDMGRLVRSVPSVRRESALHPRSVLARAAARGIRRLWIRGRISEWEA
jgi:hypothetical protein